MITFNDVNNKKGEVTLHPVGPTAFDALMSELRGMRVQLIRIETRQAKLMIDMGVNPHKEKTQ